MTEVQEQKCIRMIRSGDTEAFECLLKEYEKKVYAIAFRLLGSVQDAEDASQETFVRMWSGLSSYQAKAKFSTWLYSLCTNVCIDMLRRRKDVASLDEETDEGDKVLDPVSTAPGPEELAERAETVSEVQHAMASLPEDFRIPLALREMAQLSYAEIAVQMQIPEATVRTRIFRARVMLKEKLQKTGNFSLSLSSKQRGKNKREEGSAI